MKRYLLLLVTTIIFIILIIYLKRIPSPVYLVTGTGNPGRINLYQKEREGLRQVKIIDTGYKFVYSVRIGDIFNNGEKYIIAGVSNSFFSEPYGCKVIAYSLKNYKETLIDDVGDLRCKDLVIGDADNDGQNEILLATHGIGFVRLYQWKSNHWYKENLERNYISQIDEKNKSNHRVPSEELPCKDCTIQTAVHIVKIADVDNDGKNEVIVTMSSPLELQGADEISYIGIYRKRGNRWNRQVIDTLQNREFRSITIGDIYNNKKNILVIGVGSPRNEKGSLYAYEYIDNKWKKTIIHNDLEEKNMKGVSIGDIENNGRQEIVLATGFPNGKVIIIAWNGKSFKEKQVGTISSLFGSIKDGEFNSMAATHLTRGNDSSLFIVGMTTFPSKKIGWEGTDKGFIVYFDKRDGKWTKAVIDTSSVLGMDMYK